MPSTTELIDVLEMSAPGWNREGEKSLLKVIDQAQDILYKQEYAQNQAYRTDGELPYISTSDETYQYTLNQATTGLSYDIWRVSAVLLKYPFSNDLNDTLNIEYGIVPNIQQPVDILEFNGVEYYNFHQVAVIDARKDGYPELTFSINPGATTTDFHLLAYKKPTTITSEAIELTLPENLHFTCLLPTAVKLLEAYQTHNWIEALEMINSKYKPMVQNEMNEAAQGLSNSITRYEE